MSAPLTNEHLRILLAVWEGRLHVNESGRYVIEGQDRPDRRSREQLVKRGLIEWRWNPWSTDRWKITDKGRTALESIGFNLPPEKTA